ncbi:MAG TPA: hypothetical protein VGK73_29110 [Polyangiaceae bacterium]
MARRVILGWSAPLAATLLSLFATPAAAFEKQWHMGAGVGAAFAKEHSFGPAVNLYGAYGISDVFDVRLEAFLSTNAGYVPAPTNPNDRRPTWDGTFYGGKLALAYKLDVIEWIPYGGLTAGFLGVVPGRHEDLPDELAALEAAPPQARPFARAQFTGGVLLGLDYAVSRSFGLGLALSGDYAFGGGNGLYGAGFLRAEYRFGW